MSRSEGEAGSESGSRLLRQCRDKVVRQVRRGIVGMEGEGGGDESGVGGCEGGRNDGVRE